MAAVMMYAGMEGKPMPGMPSLLTAEQFMDMEKVLGPERILFGTDYPMFRADKELNTLFSLGFSDEELTAILSKNAEKVYHISAGQNPKE